MKPEYNSSGIGIFWTILSIIVAGVCSFSFMQPFWFVRSSIRISFGMYNYCKLDFMNSQVNTYSHICGKFGTYNHFPSMPSPVWTVSCVLFGAGCGILCISALVAVISLCVPRCLHSKVTTACGIMQLAAGILLIISMLLYPASLQSGFVRQWCGPQSDSYYSGDCHFGWSYSLAIVGTAWSFLCPVLSRFTEFRISQSTSSDNVTFIV